MKETPIFEEVFINLVKQRSFAVKALIGGLIAFVPFLNILAFGYLYQFSQENRQSGSLRMPEWDDWQNLFFDGLRFTVVWILYWLLPLSITLGLSKILSAIGLGALAYLILSVAMLLFPIIFCSALYRLQMRSEMKDIFDVVLILRMTYLQFTRFILPAFVFLGLFSLAPMLYGLTLFFGFTVMIGFTGLCFRSIERGQTTAF